MNSLAQSARRLGQIPLGWAGATEKQNYLNFGDALSPVMVAAFAGTSVVRRPMKSKAVRLACVGTIGHGFEGGDVHFWGTGMSPFRHPGAANQEPWSRPSETTLIVHATRGPLTAQRLGAGVVPYGDPVFLLPRFYDKPVVKRFEVGVIAHLSELGSRELNVGARDELKRFVIPGDLAGSIRVINTLTEISARGLERKLREILSCKRIVSTSLHGMVIAEAFGIPCLYFSPNGQPGPLDITIAETPSLDPRIADLYLGAGRAKVATYAQPRAIETDWEALIAAIDHRWQPLEHGFDDLVEVFPVDLKPLVTRNLFSHPVVTGLTFQHNVRELQLADAQSRKLTPTVARPAPPAAETAAER